MSTDRTPLVRLAFEFERRALLTTYALHARTRVADLPECAVFIHDNYLSDGPGYTGPVAFLHWAGAPTFVTILTLHGTSRDDRHWRVAQDYANDELPAQPRSPA